jgi:hypothetical protein
MHLLWRGPSCAPTDLIGRGREMMAQLATVMRPRSERCGLNRASLAPPLCFGPDLAFSIDRLLLSQGSVWGKRLRASGPVEEFGVELDRR